MNPMEEYFALEREDVEKTAQARQIRALLHKAFGKGVRITPGTSIDPNALPSGLRSMLNAAGVTSPTPIQDVVKQFHVTAQNSALPGFTPDDAQDALRLLRARQPAAFRVRPPVPPGPIGTPFGFTEQAYAIERISRAAREGRLSDDMKKFWIKHVDDLRKGPNPTWARNEFDTLFSSHLAPVPSSRVPGHVPIGAQARAVKMIEASNHLPESMKADLKSRLLTEAREGRAVSFDLLRKEVERAAHPSAAVGTGLLGSALGAALGTGATLATGGLAAPLAAPLVLGSILGGAGGGALGHLAPRGVRGAKDLALAGSGKLWGGTKAVAGGVSSANRWLKDKMQFPGVELDRRLSQARSVQQKTKALTELAEASTDPRVKKRLEDQLEVLRHAYKGRFENEALRSMARDPERAIEFTTAIKDLDRGFDAKPEGITGLIPEKMRHLFSGGLPSSSLPKPKAPSVPMGRSADEMVRNAGLHGSASSLAKVLGPAAMTGGAVSAGFRFADPKPMGSYTMDVPGVGRYEYDPKR